MKAASNDLGTSTVEFEAIKTGMSQKDVAKGVGSAGEVISENELAGIHTSMV